MGNLLSSCNAGIEKLLMPAEGSYTNEWTGFGEPTPNSLRLLDGVQLGLADTEAVRAFLTEGLGATPSAKGLCASEGNSGATFDMGLTQLTLLPSAGGQDQQAHAWPGQVYIWVEDIQHTWAMCKALSQRLGTEVVTQAVCCKDERKADVLVLQDPVGGVKFMVNQAPKGYARRLREAMATDGVEMQRSNLLGIIDLQHTVPCGYTPRIARFYRHFLQASGELMESGCRVHFAAGDISRQTLTFMEDPELPASPAEAGPPAHHEVCIHMPSQKAFLLAFQRCDGAGVVTAPAGGWQAAKETGEFHIHRCPDPASLGETVLELDHVVRAPSHPGCRLPASPEAQAHMGA